MRRVLRSWRARVSIEGPSMEPTLRAGDGLLVDTEAYIGAGPQPGDLVLVPDPRLPERLLVKRVREASSDGRQLLVAGDSPGSSTDWRAFGPVETTTVEGRPWFRYRPLSRMGRVR